MQTLILNYYPRVIRQIKEMQQIAQAEDIEFSKLHASIDEVLRNMFIHTADETGIERFERMLGITPKVGQSMDDRKINIVFAVKCKKLSLSEIIEELSNYCEGIKLIKNIFNMEMVAEISTSEVNIDMVNAILEEILPLNIYFHFKLKAEKAKTKVLASQRAGGMLKVKPLLDTRIVTGMEIGGKIKAYQRGKSTMKVRKEM